MNDKQENLHGALHECEFPCKLYVCRCKSANATGFPSPGGFTVCTGSVISERVTDSFEIANKWYYDLRNNLIASGVIQNRVFTQNYEFKSLSGAAAVILGRTGGGKQSWQPLQTEMEDKNHV